MKCPRCLFGGDMAWCPATLVWQCPECRKILRPTQKRPLARRTDPVTSQAAARTIRRSGRQAALCGEILSVLKSAPGGLTAGEIAERMQEECHTIGRRTSDLERNGLIRRNGEVRYWKGSGRQQCVWVPTIQEGVKT